MLSAKKQIERWEQIESNFPMGGDKREAMQIVSALKRGHGDVASVYELKCIIDGFLFLNNELREDMEEPMTLSPFFRQHQFLKIDQIFKKLQS